MINNENSMLVVLSVSFWSGYKKDKDASTATAEKYQMKKGTVNTNKKLLARDALQPMKDVINAYKTYFQDNTLPYNMTQGTRILPSECYFDFKQVELEAIAALNEELAEFKQHYPDYVERAKHRLGGLFKETDYPHVDDLDSKFSIRVEYLPVPEPQHFNKGISNTQVQRLNDNLNTMSREAVFDLFLRAEKTVGALHNIIVTNAQRIFHTTTTTNIEKLVHQLKTLNHSNNSDIIDLAKLIETELFGVRVDYLKNSEVYRDKLKKKTSKVLTKIAEYQDEHGR